MLTAPIDWSTQIASQRSRIVSETQTQGGIHAKGVFTNAQLITAPSIPIHEAGFSRLVTYRQVSNEAV
jgi:hypothetical protein